MERSAPADAVRVFSIELDLGEKEVAALGTVLTADELLRAGRMRAKRDRNRAVVTRAALRRLLARELGRSTEDVDFSVGSHGKPRVAGESAVRFNLSHSGGLALVAVGSVEVGVDVEELRPRGDLDGVARRVFTEAERAAVGAGGELAFYRHWVAKEAFVKATGRGVESLRSFEVVLDGPGGARLNHVGGDPRAATRWTLAMLDTAPTHVAAAVAADPDARIAQPVPFDPLR